MHSITGPQFRSSQLLKCAYRSLKWFIINIKFIAQFAKVSLCLVADWELILSIPAPLNAALRSSPRIRIEFNQIIYFFQIFFQGIFFRSGSDESASRQVTPQQHSEPSRVSSGSPLTWVEIIRDSRQSWKVFLSVFWFGLLYDVLLFQISFFLWENPYKDFS